MLSRATRRRHALRFCRRTSEQLQLPWLCPALSRNQSHIPHPRPITSRPTAATPIHHAPQSQPARQLASAAAPSEIFNRNDDDYLPFHSPSGPSQSPMRRPPLQPMGSNSILRSHLEPLDLSKVLMIDNTIQDVPERMRTNLSKDIVIRGDAHEVETTLEACLQVGRFDRALALLRQLDRLCKPGSERLIIAYNSCLEAMVLDMILNRHQKNLDKINKWVEVTMKKAGVEPNARTYALKIKSAMATLDGSQRDRTVRRYWELARKYNFDGEVAGFRDILTDRDLGRLSEICPMKLSFQLARDEYAPEETVEVTTGDAIAQNAAIDVRETNQKGLGLSSLKKSLSLFADDVPLENRDALVGTPEEIEQQYAKARQSRLETDAIDSAIERWRTEHEKMTRLGINGNLQYGKLGALLWQWHEVMAGKIRAELEMVEEAEKKQQRNPTDKLRCEYGPFLRLMSPEHMAATTTLSVIQTMSKHGVRAPVKLVQLVCQIGKIIEAEVDAEDLRTAAALEARKKRTWQKNDSAGESTSASEKPTSITSQRLPRLGLDRFNGRVTGKKYHWSAAIHARLGAVLCELLFDSAKMKVSKKAPDSEKTIHINESVFSRQFIYKDGRRLGTVMLQSDVVNMLVAEPAGDVIAKQLPMVSKPRPWRGFYDGGFLESQTSFIRIKNSEIAQRDYGEAAAIRGDLDQLFAGVDVLGKTAWKINREVFNVMLEAWNSGEEVANLPPANKVFPEIPKPTDTSDKAALGKYYRTMRDIENEKGGLHSNRCFQNFQMEIAKAYLNENFYLPHNIDFRGRAYPIPPYFNQMGADNCRGLLLFSKGRPLGSAGLRWLKIHLSNVYGYDKASLKDREDFPMDHLDDVYDSVERPLSGRRWWLTAEDPWQCLATCVELKKALESPDPCSFVSYLPVHQDGSCNGLQHYAALGGDIDGAKQVNLEPGDKPADVYTGVAELVKAEISQEALEGHELARELDGKVTRKIVKQTVMTNVYGVTFLGAIRQVKRQVDDLLPEFKQSIPPRSGAVATYIARKIFRALGAMFSGAHGIQYWLGDCANRISTSLSPAQLEKILDRDRKKGSILASGSTVLEKTTSKRKSRREKVDEVTAFRSSVIWTTPLKLPVVQPYRSPKGHRIKTNLQEISLMEPTIADAVNKRKQLQAFPPNFIHSLDATHMILSALRCDELGLSFSAVHDSFWTHAADVDTLNHVLREAFIRMHSEDIIQRLAAEFKMRYEGHFYLATVRKGTPLADKLTELRMSIHPTGKKARSPEQKRYQELILEIKRRDLLNSDDPVKQKKGAKMVTPASLFEQMNGARDLWHRDSLGQTAIGAMPEDTSDETLETALHSEDAAADVDMAQTLRPLLDSAHLHQGTTGDAASITDREVEKLSQPAEPTESLKNGPRPDNLWIWLPLTFRDVPRKGDFDVNRLRDSQYFFS